ncbi:MAG: entericidin [Pseudomonadota bacterium]
MTKHLKSLLGAAIALMASVGLMGCETIKGVGRDIEKTGEVLDNAVGDGR